MDSVTAPKREDMNRRDLLRLGVVGSAGIGGSLLMARHSFADECEIESREVCGQVEPKAGTWKTWVLASGSDLRLPPPPGRAATQRCASRWSFSRTPWKVLSRRSQPAASSKPQSARGSPPQCTNGWITPNPFALMPTIAVVSPEWLGNHGKRLCGAPRADVSSAVGRADRAAEQVR